MILLGGIAAVYGWVVAYLFRRLTNRRQFHTAADRMIAHTLEFRLFFDEPGTVLRAQRNLVRANLLLLRSVALPGIVGTLVFAALYWPLAQSFGHRALPVGTRLVVSGAEIPGTIAETPGVRIPREQAEFRRVRVTGPNRLGRAPWLTWFLGSSSLAACAVYLSERIRRTVP